MTPDPMAVAIEHIAWAVREGISLSDLHNALGAEAGPSFKHWEDALYRLVRIESDMQFRLEHPPRRQRAAPFRRREPPRSAAWPARGAA